MLFKRCGSNFLSYITTMNQGLLLMQGMSTLSCSSSMKCSHLRPGVADRLDQLWHAPWRIVRSFISSVSSHVARIAGANRIKYSKPRPGSALQLQSTINVSMLNSFVFMTRYRTTSVGLFFWAASWTGRMPSLFRIIKDSLQDSTSSFMT